MKVEHWMMFSTFSEQNYYEYPTEGTYDGIIINANMAAHASAGMASFLLEKTTGKSKYIIDPMTHAFQHNPSLVSNSDGEIKSSIKVLSENYGEPVLSMAGKRPLSIDDFKNKDIFNSFIKNVLSFQHNHLKDYMAKSDAAKYLDDNEIKPPYAVIAPYFYLSETNIKKWLPICIQSIELSQKYKQAKKLFCSIVLSQGVLLDEGLLERIIEEYTKVQECVDGYLIWIDNLEEQSASKTVLEHLLKLIKEIRNDKKKEVINLHGGYFSILAAGVLDNSFSGVTHGPEFGEFRGVIPVGGGIPIARYYINKLHSRIRYKIAIDILNRMDWLKSTNDFYDNVCDCQECKDVIKDNTDNFKLFGESSTKSIKRKNVIMRIDYPTIDAKKRCLKHYLQNKNIEYMNSQNKSKDVLLNELSTYYEQFSNKIGDDEIAHLLKWYDVLINRDNAN